MFRKILLLNLIILFSITCSLFANPFTEDLVNICKLETERLRLYDDLEAAQPELKKQYEKVLKQIETKISGIKDLFANKIGEDNNEIDVLINFVNSYKALEMCAYSDVFESLKDTCEIYFYSVASGSSEEMFIEDRLGKVIKAHKHLKKIRKLYEEDGIRHKFVVETESSNTGDLFANLPANLKAYYSDAKGKKGEELFKALNKITGRGYKSHGYGESRYFMYGKLDNKNGKVLAFYSQKWISGNGKSYKERGDENKDGTSNDFINCEHSWPQSMFNKALPMRSDIHHLFPTLSKPNGMRSNYPFGEVKGNVKYKTSSNSKLSYSKLFEPCDEQKGNTARAMLYFYVRYYNRHIKSGAYTENGFWDSKVPMFIKWHKMDPPDAAEKERNNGIHKFQGNRNPFVDEPALVDAIGANVFQSISSRYEISPAIMDSARANLDTYYKDAKGKKGEALFHALHRITGKGYKAHGYRESRYHMYGKLDNKNGKCFAFYSQMWISGKGNSYTERGDENKDGTSGDFVNCEHSWPQSMFSKAAPMRSDIHHLFPTLSKPNGMRSNYPFGIVTKAKYKTSSNSKLSSSKLFEPCDEQKGNTARAMLYFYVRYHNKNIRQGAFSENKFWDSKVPMFIKWHKMDPPDSAEKKRNDGIYKYQGNRNPFIDHPEYVDQIGTSIFQNL